MEIKHINQIHERLSESHQETIEALRDLLSVSDMKKATVKFKLNYEGQHDDNNDSLYGVGYVFQTIINSQLDERDDFLANGKFIVGWYKGREECWLAFGDWFIYADGYHTITWFRSDDEQFTAGIDIPAIDIYERYFAPNNPTPLRA